LSFYRWRYFQDIMLGALEVADRDGYGLLTLTHLTVDSPHHAQRAALPTITQHDVDGLITYGPTTSPAVITWLRKDEGFGRPSDRLHRGAYGMLGDPDRRRAGDLRRRPPSARPRTSLPPAVHLR
jgi:hypothetical protein